MAKPKKKLKKNPGAGLSAGRMDYGIERRTAEKYCSRRGELDRQDRERRRRGGRLSEISM